MPLVSEWLRTLYIWGACHLTTPPPPDLSIWIATVWGGGGQRKKKEWGKERMKGWVDVMPRTHIYLFPGQGVCCVIALLHLARQQLTEALWKDVSDLRYVTSFPNSCTLKNVFKLSGLNRLIFSNDVNHPNYRETIFLEFPLNRTAANIFFWVLKKNINKYSLKQGLI